MIFTSLFERRATKEGPSSPRDPAYWLQRLFGGMPTAAGETVSEKGAMSLSAYFAAIRAISEDVGKLPLNVYRRLTPRGKEKMSTHPVHRLLHTQPNDEMTAMAFREAITAHALGWGRGIAEIQRNRGGRPVALHLIEPERVTAKRSSKGKLYWEIQRPDGGTPDDLSDDDVLHVHGLTHNGITGYSIAGLARETIGTGFATEKFAASFFANGATPGVVLEHPKTLSETAAKNIKASWNSEHQGAGRAHGVAVAEEGMKVVKLSIPNNDAQFIESRQFTVEEIARWFRIPPHKIQHLLRSTFSNIEAQSIEYVVDTLHPWLVRWEQEVLRKLFTPSERDLFAEHLVDGLLRGETSARYEAYNKGIQAGILNPNEARDRENLNPYEGGDRYRMPLNMTDASLPPPAPAPGNAPSTPAPTPADTPAPTTGDNGQRVAAVKKAHAAMLADVLTRLQTMEAAKVQKAVKTHGAGDNFRGWAGSFAIEHADHVRGIIGVAMDAAAASLWALRSDLPMTETAGKAAVRATASIAMQHAVNLRSELGDGSQTEQVIANWTPQRIGALAADYIEQLAQAIGAHHEHDQD